MVKKGKEGGKGLPDFDLPFLTGILIGCKMAGMHMHAHI